MRKIIYSCISVFLCLSIMTGILGISVYADEPEVLTVLPKPTISVSSDKSTYSYGDAATVSVSINSECPLENVTATVELDNQLMTKVKEPITKNTDLLNDNDINFSFEVLVSNSANGLSFFQKIVLFFKRLFNKAYSSTPIRFNDGRVKTSESIVLQFGNAKGTVTVNAWYNNKISDTDTDKDGVIDYVERVKNMDIHSEDTDQDGLSDYSELVIIGTDPTEADTDKNGINDYNDDNDNDGLSNGSELDKGTSPNSEDTDEDRLSDSEEINKYKTNPTLFDTDEDGAGDGWEIQNGYNPREKNDYFSVNKEMSYGNITASVSLKTTGNNVESTTIVPVINNKFINSSIPGYIGNAFEFNTNGEIGIADLSFEFDEKLLENPEFDPTVYCLNEETQTWYKYDTKIEGNKATANTTHFSTYILLDKTVYERALQNMYSIDYSLDTGVDSNNDGITDYITKLMCDGIILSGYGTKIFGDYTFEDVQKNNDIDDDGIINGEEININPIVNVPNDAFCWDGHYYKRYDTGYVWDDAESYCESIGGYLMTVTSQAEQNILESLIKDGSKNSYWLGSRETDGIYKWITGEEFGYTNWAYGQPDNHWYSDYEDCLMVYNGYNPNNYNETGQWNDLNNHAICGDEPFFGIDDFGFICEWGTFSKTNYAYAFVNSSPIYTDSDCDGFVDSLDPTPNKPDVFKSIEEYNNYYFPECPTITFFARVPIYDSRTCMSLSDDGSIYVTRGPAGHSFVSVKDTNGEFDYFGFGGITNNFETAALFRQKLEPDYYEESKSEWTVGKTFVISDEVIDNVYSWVESFKNSSPKYKVDTNNCTTFAVKVLKSAGLSPRIYEHEWTIEGSLLDIFASSYYGYCPADAAMDIKDNYNSYVLCSKYYKLKDGSYYSGAVEVKGNPYLDEQEYFYEYVLN